MTGIYLRREPIGLGTYQAESLPSRVIRLAWAHGYSVSKFIDLIGNVNPNVKARWPNVSDRYIVPREMLGVTEKTGFVLDLMETIYRDNTFRRSSLFDFSKDVKVPLQLIKAEIQWCPLCFMEHAGNREEPYLRMYWDFHTSKVCLRHFVRLTSRCERCGKRQNMNQVSKSMSVCCSCGEYVFLDDLWFYQKSVDKVSISAMHIQELIEYLSSGNYPTIGQHRKNIILSICHQLRKGVRPIDSYQIDFSETSEILDNLGCNTDEEVSLFWLIRFALIYEISVMEILTGESRFKQLSFMDNDGVSEVAVDIRPKANRLRDHKRVFREFYDCIYSNGRLGPLHTIARKLGVSVGYLEYRFPSGVADYRNRYQRQKEVESSECKRALMEEIEKELTKRGWPDGYVSRKKLVAAVREKTSAGRNLIDRIAKEYMCTKLAGSRRSIK